MKVKVRKYNIEHCVEDLDIPLAYKTFIEYEQYNTTEYTLLTNQNNTIYMVRLKFFEDEFDSVFFDEFFEITEDEYNNIKQNMISIEEFKELYNKFLLWDNIFDNGV